MEQLLLSPDTAPVPADPAALYAVSGALTHIATAANFGRIYTYLERLPKEHAVFTARSIARGDEHRAKKGQDRITDTEAFQRWSLANTALLS